jgi:tetraacyldisaccharide 4'-kinase
VIPAGPLREPVARGLARARAVVVMGDDRAGVARALPVGMKVLRARLRPENGAEFRGRRVVAFAGIARPGRLFEALAALEAILVGRFPYPDHFPYPRAEVERLLGLARTGNARLVTTAKDWVRLPPELRAEVGVLHVRAVFEDEAALDSLLEALPHG